ncbi:MAG: ubiquinol-cytochrome c reductase iron-sulfur subunit [Thermoanaerobaculia bacterium]
MTDADRRGFLGWFLSTSFGALAASIAYPVVRFVSPPDIPEAAMNEVEAGATNDPELLENGYKILRFGTEPVILLRAGEGDFRAFAATCTHLDCIVEYHKDQKRIWCNCHNGEYNLRGQQVAGPPPKPLQAFKVDLVVQAVGEPEQIVVSRA